MSNIEKRLAVPPASASSTRSVSQVDANDRTRLMKQPPNLPPPPPTFNSSVINDMKGQINTLIHIQTCTKASILLYAVVLREPLQMNG